MVCRLGYRHIGAAARVGTPRCANPLAPAFRPLPPSQHAPSWLAEQTCSTCKTTLPSRATQPETRCPGYSSPTFSFRPSWAVPASPAARAAAWSEPYWNEPFSMSSVPSPAGPSKPTRSPGSGLTTTPPSPLCGSRTTSASTPAGYGPGSRRGRPRQRPVGPIVGCVDARRRRTTGRLTSRSVSPDSHRAGEIDSPRTRPAMTRAGARVPPSGLPAAGRRHRQGRRRQERRGRRARARGRRRGPARARGRDRARAGSGALLGATQGAGRSRGSCRRVSSFASVEPEEALGDFVHGVLRFRVLSAPAAREHVASRCWRRPRPASRSSSSSTSCTAGSTRGGSAGRVYDLVVVDAPASGHSLPLLDGATHARRARPDRPSRRQAGRHRRHARRPRRRPSSASSPRPRSWRCGRPSSCIASWRGARSPRRAADRQRHSAAAASAPPTRRRSKRLAERGEHHPWLDAARFLLERRRQARAAGRRSCGARSAPPQSACRSCSRARSRRAASPCSPPSWPRRRARRMTLAELHRRAPTRPLRRQRRRRQDDDRGGAGRRGGATRTAHGRPHRRPRAAPARTRSGSATLDGKPRRVPLAAVAAHLDAMLLDVKRTFDELVRRARVDARAGPTHPRQPALPEPVGHAGRQRRVHGRRVGASAWRRSGDYDLVVVDTPPARHAVDFLDAPRRLLALLDSRAFAILKDPT